jgi:hypothetical protein
MAFSLMHALPVMVRQALGAVLALTAVVAAADAGAGADGANAPAHRDAADAVDQLLSAGGLDLSMDDTSAVRDFIVRCELRRPDGAAPGDAVELLAARRGTSAALLIRSPGAGLPFSLVTRGFTIAVDEANPGGLVVSRAGLRPAFVATFDDKKGTTQFAGGALPATASARIDVHLQAILASARSAATSIVRLPGGQWAVRTPHTTTLVFPDPDGPFPVKGLEISYDDGKRIRLAVYADAAMAGRLTGVGWEALDALGLPVRMLADAGADRFPLMPSAKFPRDDATRAAAQRLDSLFVGIPGARPSGPATRPGEAAAPWADRLGQRAEAMLERLENIALSENLTIAQRQRIVAMFRQRRAELAGATEALASGAAERAGAAARVAAAVSVLPELRAVLGDDAMFTDLGRWMAIDGPGPDGGPLQTFYSALSTLAGLLDLSESERAALAAFLLDDALRVHAAMARVMANVASEEELQWLRESSGDEVVSGLKRLLPPDQYVRLERQMANARTGNAPMTRCRGPADTRALSSRNRPAKLIGVHHAHPPAAMSAAEHTRVRDCHGVRSGCHGAKSPGAAQQTAGFTAVAPLLRGRGSAADIRGHLARPA